MLKCIPFYRRKRSCTPLSAETEAAASFPRQSIIYIKEASLKWRKLCGNYSSIAVIYNSVQ